MKMFAELSNDRNSIVEVCTQHHQGICVQDDNLVLGEEEGNYDSNRQRDQQQVDELTPLTCHLGDDESTLGCEKMRERERERGSE